MASLRFSLALGYGGSKAEGAQGHLCTASAKVSLDDLQR